MHKKKTGLLHLFATIQHAFDGLKVLSQEVAFKHEVIFLCCNLVIFAFLGVSIEKYFIAFMLWFMLIATEAINTAIENIVDKISPEISDFAKNTKDLASFAVFSMIAINIFFNVFILYIFINS